MTADANRFGANNEARKPVSKVKRGLAIEIEILVVYLFRKLSLDVSGWRGWLGR